MTGAAGFTGIGSGASSDDQDVDLHQAVLLTIAFAAGGFTLHRLVRRHGREDWWQFCGLVAGAALVGVLTYFAAYSIMIIVLATLFAIA